MKNRPAKKRNSRIAKVIARALFTNGSKQRAERLVLELKDNRDSGGWCEQAAADQIEVILNGSYH